MHTLVCDACVLVKTRQWNDFIIGWCNYCRFMPEPTYGHSSDIYILLLSAWFILKFVFPRSLSRQRIENEKRNMMKWKKKFKWTRRDPFYGMRRSDNLKIRLLNFARLFHCRFAFSFFLLIFIFCAPSSRLLHSLLTWLGCGTFLPLLPGWTVTWCRCVWVYTLHIAFLADEFKLEVRLGALFYFP